VGKAVDQGQDEIKMNLSLPEGGYLEDSATTPAPGYQLLKCVNSAEEVDTIRQEMALHAHKSSSKFKRRWYRCKKYEKTGCRFRMKVQVRGWDTEKGQGKSYDVYTLGEHLCHRGAEEVGGKGIQTEVGH
jgi:hypothetical protein